MSSDLKQEMKRRQLEVFDSYDYSLIQMALDRLVEKQEIKSYDIKEVGFNKYTYIMKENVKLKKIIRVTVDFPKALYNELEELSNLINDSKATALRKSMRITSALLKEIKKGNKIVIEGNNSSKELIIL